jgi:tRNA G18 (ribose-2'-O)-methylase SpoU
VRLITKLKKQGFFVVAVEQDPRSLPYNAIDFGTYEKIAFIMGTEVTGIEKSLLKRVDCIAELPMEGGKESLNVGVTFGIMAYKIKEELDKTK